LARVGDSHGIATVLQGMPAAIAAIDEAGQTPLHVAAESGHLAAANLLVARGADVNARDSSGLTPLHLATALGLVRVLVDAGADLEATSFKRETPLQNAVRESRSAVASALVHSGARLDLKSAVLLRKEEEALALMRNDPQAGREIDFLREGVGHWAARRGAHRVLQSLSAEQVRAVSKQGHTPLHVAALKGDVDAMRILAAKDAGIDTVRCRGADTPLHLAAASGHVAAARLLLEWGAHPDHRNALGQTPLHYAARSSDNAGVIRLLVRAGARREARDIDGQTPYDMAQRCGSRELLAILSTGP
jgi:ankyrin repeat protein